MHVRIRDTSVMQHKQSTRLQRGLHLASLTRHPNIILVAEKNGVPSTQGDRIPKIRNQTAARPLHITHALVLFGKAADDLLCFAAGAIVRYDYFILWLELR